MPLPVLHVSPRFQLFDRFPIVKTWNVIDRAADPADLPIDQIRLAGDFIDNCARRDPIFLIWKIVGSWRRNGVYNLRRGKGNGLGFLDVREEKRREEVVGEEKDRDAEKENKENKEKWVFSLVYISLDRCHFLLQASATRRRNGKEKERG